MDWKPNTHSEVVTAALQLHLVLHEHELGLSHSLSILNEKLKVLGIPEATISNIIDELNAGDLLKLYNRGVLSTDIKRKGVFKKSFNCVEPVPQFLGTDENGKECFAQYVPVQETLTSLFKNESVQDQYVTTRLQPSIRMLGMEREFKVICC